MIFNDLKTGFMADKAQMIGRYKNEFCFEVRDLNGIFLMVKGINELNFFLKSIELPNYINTIKWSNFYRDLPTDDIRGIMKNLNTHFNRYL